LFGFVAPAGLAVGALVGGGFAARRGARAATAAGIGAVAVAVTVFVVTRAAGLIVDPWLWLAPLGLLYLGAGFLICASYTLLMSLSRGRYAATRFSLFMSATNGCEAWAAFVGGRLSAPLGQSGAMVALVVASLLALPALLLSSLRPKARASNLAE
jgi:predicted MFS family arabinose efflux permease